MRTRRRCCRTSRQGKPLELDALVGAVVELGRLTNTPTPHIDAVYACASLLAKTAVEQGSRVAVARVMVGAHAHPTHAYPKYIEPALHHVLDA